VLHRSNPDAFEITWDGSGELTRPWQRGSWRGIESSALKNVFRDGRLPARSSPSTSQSRPANPLRNTEGVPRAPRAAGLQRRQDLEQSEYSIRWLRTLWNRVPVVTLEAAHALFERLDADPSFNDTIWELEQAVSAEVVDWTPAPAHKVVTIASALYGLRDAFDRACSDIARWPFELRWIAFCDGVRQAAEQVDVDVEGALADCLRVAVHGPVALASIKARLGKNAANDKSFIALRARLDPVNPATVSPADAEDALNHLAKIAIRRDLGRWRSLQARGPALSDAQKRRGQALADLQAAIMGELLHRYPTLNLLEWTLAYVDERLAITPRAGLEALSRTVRAEAAPESVRVVAFQFQHEDRKDPDRPRDRQTAGATHYDDDGHHRITLRVNLDTEAVDHLRLEIDPDTLAEAVRALRRRTGAQAKRFAAAEACLLTEATPEQIAQEHGCSVRSLPAWQAEFVEALKAQIYKLKNRKNDSK
jgi:hypothetical protein